jgi:hypothetical protein
MASHVRTFSLDILTKGVQNRLDNPSEFVSALPASIFTSPVTVPRDGKGDILLPEQYQHVRNWFQDCQKSHSAFGCCGLLSSIELTFLDCRLERMVTLPAGTPYVALSYVWGRNPVAQSDHSSAQWHTLPPTIRDAAFLTLQVGERYLWIDRYCIDQTDNLQKHNLISNMHDIYSHASWVVVAATGESVEEGLPGVSTSMVALPINPTMVGEYGLFTHRPSPRDLIQESVWNTRGWTYQEAVLARRTVVLTNSVIYLQCMEGQEFGWSFMQGPRFVWTNESNIRRGQRRRVFQTEAFDLLQDEKRYTAVVDRFQQHIASYLKRVLTFEHDHLNAISGVLNEFGRNSSHPLFQYWGLPNSPTRFWTTGDALNWRCEWPLTRRQGFPSWSWVGYHFDNNKSHLLWRSTHDLDHRQPGVLEPNISVELENKLLVNLDDLDAVLGTPEADALHLQRLSHVLVLDTHVERLELRHDPRGKFVTKRIDEGGLSLRNAVKTNSTWCMGSVEANKRIDVQIDLDIGDWTTFAQHVRDNYVLCAFVAEDSRGFSFLMLTEEDGYFTRIGIAEFASRPPGTQMMSEHESAQHRAKVAALRRRVIKLK